MIFFEPDSRQIPLQPNTAPAPLSGWYLPDADCSLLRELEDFRTKDEIQTDDRTGK